MPEPAEGQRRDQLERLLGAHRYAELVEQTTLIVHGGVPAVEMAERFREASRKLRAATAPCSPAQRRALDALKRLGAELDQNARRRHGCCDHTRTLFNWLRHAEYVAAWEPIPVTERPGYTVAPDGDGWKAVPHA